MAYQGAQAVRVPMPDPQPSPSPRQPSSSPRRSQLRPRPSACPVCHKSLAPGEFRCIKFNFKRGCCGVCARRLQRQQRRQSAARFAADAPYAAPASPTGSDDSGIDMMVLPWISVRDPAEQLRTAGLLNDEDFGAFCVRNSIVNDQALLARLAQVLQEEVDRAEIAALALDLSNMNHPPASQPHDEVRGFEPGASAKRGTRGGVMRGNTDASGSVTRKRGTAGNRDSAISVTSGSVDDDEEDEEENNEPHCEGTICQAASDKLAALCAMSQSDQKKHAHCLFASDVKLDLLPAKSKLKVDKAELVAVQHCKCTKHMKHAMCVKLTGRMTTGRNEKPFCALMCIAFVANQATYRATCLQFQCSKLGMVFLDDVTIPDNTKVKRGSTIEKKWKVLNIGHEAFGTGTSNIVGMLRGKKKCLECHAVPATQPGEVAELTVPHKLPTSKKGGYVSDWVLHKDGKAFGDPFWLAVQLV
eukprot:m.221655 g.221655  ORF g.221655 m.221655 type:complete len:472 (-) comp18721_c1_seq2:343-1758(-)